MSLPVEEARKLAKSLRTPGILNLFAQSKAKQVLREVREAPANYPRFESDLDDRVTFAAYALMAAGCSLIEGGKSAEGRIELQAAADILESAHRTNVSGEKTSALHCLIGAMSFYACGQYSRAFVLIKQIDGSTPSAAVIASFLRKDSSRLIASLNAVLLPEPPDFDDTSTFDDWALTVCLARAVSLAGEYALTGDHDLLASADAVLGDAMLISEAGSNPGFWWIARLMRLMFKDYSTGALWSVLPPLFGPDGLDQVDSYIKLLALSKPPVTELWQSQIAALRLALNTENQGGVVNLRTSAGKTRVAELAILQTLRKDPTAKILYLAPFRSLAFELERTFTKTLTPLGFHVSHLYGGLRFSGVDREMVDEGHVTIATPEKAKAMLRAAPELLTSVKLVVVDEGHLLGDNDRNIRNELFLEHLRLAARRHGARMLLLSAVLPNAGDLAAWVGGEAGALIKSDWKPSAERFGTLRWKSSGVSIEWLGGQRCFNPHFVEFKEVLKGKKSKRTFPETKSEAVAATAVRLAELGPVLIFAGQAQWVPSMVKSVLLALGADATDHPWPDTEWRILEAVCTEELGEHSTEIAAARKGVISHSNKLPPQVRISLEKLIAKHPPKVIVATTTLGQGVNIGISSVIVATTCIGKNLFISKRDFWNICGRAGRAFVDSEGKILFAIDETNAPEKIKQDELTAAKYLDIAHLDQVDSGLLQLVRFLYRRAAQAGITFEALLELASNDNFDRFKSEKPRIEGVIDWIDDQLLSLHVEYNGDDLSPSVDWVDDAFRDSLAAIQERVRKEKGQDDLLIRFLKARAIGVLRKVPTPEARRAIVASGLPLSVGITAFDQLDTFREMVDRYLDDESSPGALPGLIKEFETWARENAKSIVTDIPGAELLDNVRPGWLAGESLHSLVKSCGDETPYICTQLYGYQLPWLIHSVAQKLHKTDEELRVKALSNAGLFLELGLPTESAAKVYLAGVRSRVAAVELSQFVTKPVASSTRIRAALLKPKTVAALSKSVSPSTLEWLRLLSAEHGAPEESTPNCPRFRFEAPAGISVLHARRLGPRDSVWLCSADARFKRAVRSTEELPFDKLANDPRFTFVRDGDAWAQHCRDPRL